MENLIFCALRKIIYEYFEKSKQISADQQT